MVLGDLFLSVKQHRLEATHSFTFGALLKDVWSYTSTPTYALIVCAGKTLPFTKQYSS